jgi:hypothetical protein
MSQSLGIDYQMYSTYQDLVNDVNQWQCPNFDIPGTSAVHFIDHSFAVVSHGQELGFQPVALARITNRANGMTN